MAPWRDRRIGTSDPNGGRLGWLRLNADTLFLALLAAGAGTFNLIDPSGDDVTAAAGGVVYPLHYLQAGSYILAGLCLIYALVRGRVRPEVLARAVLLGGVCLGVWRHVIVLGWADSDTVEAYVLLAIVAGTSVLRLSMLLNPGGLMVTRAASNPSNGGA